MAKEKHALIVYNADGVEFTIYKTVKPTKSGPRVYWVLADSTSGKRRLLNHTTKKAARERANELRAAMVKGQANRLALSHAEWQDVCVAREIFRGMGCNSLTTAAQDWADCTLRLGGKVSLLEAVQFYVKHYAEGGSTPQPTGLGEAAKKYHQFKLDAGKSKGHCKNIKCRMDRLLEALPPGVRLDELTAGQLDVVIVAFGVREKTRNEYRMMLNNFYSWAAKQNPPLVSKASTRRRRWSAIK